MDLQPRLIEVATPPDPQGAVLVMHGGASRRHTMAVSPAQLSVLRMVPIANAIARAGKQRLSVFRLLNSARGWGTGTTPVDDALWAIGEMASRSEEPVPVCLVGHSLGGRAAILAAGDPRVKGVVVLAPWVYPTDVPRGIAGKPLLIVHGSADRIARPERSAVLAGNLNAQGADVRYETVEGGKHAMLRHHARFSGPAAEFVLETLL